ncbi:thioester-containing protein 1 allele R1-like [Toxorhynchites rutilus septentrionalis]|uniref:thioester-containing protein 1 allele R1-like n=1 Tax=Toxorhynchites rutilus septentrionalis TaxID=329112 RepID=UPI0024797D10|nr:thioester-containing protein 1 allele R1-like [Toxorhynchites rutilus septentrionalis]
MKSAVMIALSFLLLMSDPAAASNQQNYVILAPNYIRKNTDIVVTVSNAGPGYAEFEVTLEKTTELGKKKELKSIISVAERDATRLRFKQPLSSNSEKCNLKIQDTGLKNKVHEIELKVVGKTVALLIQTDKPIYKPGDTIKFRVLVLDRKIKPLTTLKSVRVQLRDSKQSLIREWPYAKLQNGVFQSQLDLANFVVLGNWSITVEALNSEVKHKTIVVAEYVLPKHEILITYPKFATFEDKTLQLIIDAKYTFGKPIKGSLSVSVVDTDKQSESAINGRAHITISLQDVLPSNRNVEVLWIEVAATIEESVSGQLYETTESIPIYRNSHKISLRKSSEYLLPDLPFKCWIVLTDPIGQPLENPGKLKVEANRIIKYWFDKSTFVEQTPNKDGVLPLMFDTSDSTVQLNIAVTYDGKTTHFTIDRIDDQDMNAPYVTVSVLTETPILDELVDVQVHSSFAMTYLLYQVTALGEMVTSGHMLVKSERKAVFRFRTAFEMLPTASVVVFVVHNDQLFSDVVEFKVQNLNNYVNLTLSQTETEPGNPLMVGVRTKPGSMIGLLGIDKSVLLLGSGNDITKETLFDELQSFGSEIQDHDKFKRLGFSVFTNAHVKPEVDELPAVLLDTRFGFDDEDEQQYAPTNLIIRKDFPETWLWTDMISVDDDGELTINDIVPDSITSWSISAFSINSEHGLGILDRPVSLIVLKPFFITVNVAYSIIKTEIALVEVFVFNYMEQAQEATIRLTNDRGEFQFADEQNQTTAELQQLRTAAIPASNVAKVTFLLKPLKTGDLVITVIAETATRKDAVEQILKVTSGGLQYYRNTARYIEVDNSSQRFENIRLIIPHAVTVGSEEIIFSVEGMLLGAALRNLGNLIRLPSGCGEQNMLKLVPSVLALEYMSSTDTLDPSIEHKALDYLKRGYQNQLKYKLDDGSFSVFGKRDGKGSVFLTAFVASTFRLVGNHINVDDKIVKTAYNWVEKQQGSDGKFSELGKIYHRGIQGGISGGVSLTAYTLIAFLEHKNTVQKYKSVIDKGTAFISNKIHQLNNPYELSLVAYALQLAKHPQRQHPLDKLLELSKRDSNLTMRWWDSGPTSIETTGYALLTYISLGMYVDAEPIMRWLVSQRYDKGGYDNTQNTYVGLHALAEYSRKLSVSRNNYEIAVSYGSEKPALVRVDAKSSMTTQNLSLPSYVRDVDVMITGTGTGVFQIAYQYNLIASDDEPRFRINNTIKTNTESTISMIICARFKPKSVYEVTNMVLMEVLFPSGYVILDRTLTQLGKVADVRKLETKRDDTMLVLYFDPLPAEKTICVDVSGFRKAIVLGQISGWVKVYDYYDPTREAFEYFDGATAGT